MADEALPDLDLPDGVAGLGLAGVGVEVSNLAFFAAVGVSALGVEGALLLLDASPPANKERKIIRSEGLSIEKQCSIIDIQTGAHKLRSLTSACNSVHVTSLSSHVEVRMLRAYVILITDKPGLQFVRIRSRITKLIKNGIIILRANQSQTLDVPMLLRFPPEE